jgi:hypothetical protein
VHRVAQVSGRIVLGSRLEPLQLNARAPSAAASSEMRCLLWSTSAFNFCSSSLRCS